MQPSTGEKQARFNGSVKGAFQARQKACITENVGDIFSMAFDHDGKSIAVELIAGGDGNIKVFSTFNGKLQHTMFTISGPHMDDKNPVTSLRWRPSDGGKPSTHLISTTADGRLEHWHAATGKNVSTIKCENDNSLLCMDIRNSADLVACAGVDTFVYVYDEHTKQLRQKMKSGGKFHPGHSSRIFAMKFHPNDHNLLVTGGWDHTLQLYDLRSDKCIGSMYGPYISGDALDISDDMVLTGSNRNNDCVQIFSLSMRKSVASMNFEGSRSIPESGFVFSSRFSKPSPQLIFAGGSGLNELKIFENNVTGSNSFKLLMTVQEFNSPCLAIDTSPTGDTFAFGCSDGKVFLCQYKLDETQAEFEGYSFQEKYVPLHKQETVVEYKDLPKGDEGEDKFEEDQMEEESKGE